MAFANAASCDRRSVVGIKTCDQLGEPVLVTPCERRMTGTIRPLDDHVFACHAAFDWLSSNVTVTTRGGNLLRYKSIRQTARFSRASLPHAVRPSDRILRTWDAVEFEIVSVKGDGNGHVICELVERGQKQQ